MMRQVLTVMTVFASLLTCVSAQARDWDEFWSGCCLDYRRNQAWPQPFLPREQCAVRQPFSVMVLQGWQEQNTLTESHFDPESNELNHAGLYKIQSVLQNSPPSQRSIFVHTGYDQVANQARLNNVRSLIGKWVPETETPAIVATPHRPYGLPGMQADSITRRFQEGMPAPTIPVSLGGRAGGLGGGGGGGGGNR